MTAMHAHALRKSNSIKDSVMKENQPSSAHLPQKLQLFVPVVASRSQNDMLAWLFLDLSILCADYLLPAVMGEDFTFLCHPPPFSAPISQYSKSSVLTKCMLKVSILLRCVNGDHESHVVFLNYLSFPTWYFFF